MTEKYYLDVSSRHYRIRQECSLDVDRETIHGYARLLPHTSKLNNHAVVYRYATGRVVKSRHLRPATLLTC